jgi:hypothetical protein
MDHQFKLQKKKKQHLLGSDAMKCGRKLPMSRGHQVPRPSAWTSAIYRENGGIWSLQNVGEDQLAKTAPHYRQMTVTETVSQLRLLCAKQANVHSSINWSAIH